MQIKLSYGIGFREMNIDPAHLKGILTSKMHEYKPSESESGLVRHALANPIDSVRLKQMAKGKKNIVIISSDHTRPVPSHIIMPIVLDEIRDTNPSAKITVLVATGFHRTTTEAELRAKYGDKIVEDVHFHVHDCINDEMTDLGILPSGGALLVNKLAVESDLLIAEGFIEPHFFAGFSGGRKSVLPGIVSYKTLLANHCAEFIASPQARAGMLQGNPLHLDMVYASKAAKLAFAINVAIDSNKKVIKAFAGHPESAHETGCDFVRKHARVKKVPSDIVFVTNGGYPLDQNIYQAVKGMTAAEATVKVGGVIVMVAECADGHGGEGFFSAFATAKGAREVHDQILLRSREETEPDQWEAQILSRVLLKADVIMVTDAPREIVEAMHMLWAGSLDEALALAVNRIKKPDYTITVIPDGVSVIVEQ